MDNNEYEDDELCKIGSILWHESVDAIDVFNEKYKKYVDHVSSCAECKRRLEINEVIPEDELTPCGSTMTTEDKLEALALREKACAAAYAKGVKDTLVLSLAAIVMTAFGVYVLF